MIIRPRSVSTNWPSFVSDTAVEILKRTRDDLLGSSDRDLLAAGEHLRVDAWRRSRASAGSLSVLLRKGDGTYANGTLFGSPDDAVPDVYFVVPSEAPEISSLGAAASQVLQDALERLPTGAATFQDGVLTFASHRFCTTLGCGDSSELLGLSSATLVAPRHRALFDAALARATPNSTATRAFETRLRRADGQFATALVSCVGLNTPSTITALLLVHDTKSSRAPLGEKLISDRSTALGTLVAGVAHEINNPLAYVTLNLHFVARELPRCTGNPELRKLLLERLAEAQHGAARVSAIVRDLRTFSRTEHEERVEPVDLVSVLEQSVRMLDLAQPVRIRRVFVPVPPIMGNAARLEQVFLNLLLNAAQALPDTEPARRVITLELKPWSDNGRSLVEASVRDGGAGIPAELLDRVFDPFFTTKGPSTGTGLGLPICHNIITRLGGEIRAESQLGVGTTFHVRLPVADRAVARPLARVMTPMPQNLTTRARLLVIDDEPQVALVLARLLRQEYEVVVSMSGQDASNLLNHDKRFDLILCDLLMPGVSGMDLYRELQQQSPGFETRIVFITGGAFTPRAAQFLQNVPNPRLEKPFDLERVRSSVRKLVAARLR